MPIARDLSVLRRRDFRLLFAARSISFFGSSMVPIAIAFAFLESTVDDAIVQLGLVLACGAIAQTSLLLFGGVIADRFSRRRVMIAAEVLSGISQLAIALMFLGDGVPVIGVLVAYAVKGSASAMFMPAAAAMVPQTVPEESLQSANALMRLTANVARLLGAGTAGAMTAIWGASSALFLDAGTFLLSALLIALIRVHTTSTTGARGFTFLADLREGWREFRSRQWVWILVLQAALVNMSIGAFTAILGPEAARMDTSGALGWSVVVTVQAIGFIVGSALALTVTPRRPLVVAVVLASTIAVPTALLGSGVSLVFVAVAAFGYAICADFYGTIWDTTLQRRVPKHVLSRVVSYDMLGSFVAAPIGLAAAGYLADRFGVSAVLTGSAIMCLATVPLALSFSSVRNLTVVAEPEPEPDRAPRQPADAGAVDG